MAELTQRRGTRSERRTPITLKQLAAALALFDVSLARHLEDWAGLDLGRVREKLNGLSQSEPGVCWAVVDKQNMGATVFGSLFDAAEGHDPDVQFIAACRVHEGTLQLRLHGIWGDFPASREASLK
jgi:hypothetical protein